MNQSKFDRRYREDYYVRSVSPRAARAAPVVAESIWATWRPRCAVDVGCGAGDLLEALSRRGIECYGVERSQAALSICRHKGLVTVRCDLEDRHPSLPPADVAVCMEVAEHLAPSSADRLVDLLCGLGDAIVFTAARPGQGGNGHVNEQPKAYWIERFAVRGFMHDRAMSETWASAWERTGLVESWYWQNLMVFWRS